MAHVVNHIDPFVVLIQSHSSWPAQLAGAPPFFAEFKQKIFLIVIDINATHVFTQKVYPAGAVYFHIAYCGLLFFHFSQSVNRDQEMGKRAILIQNHHAVKAAAGYVKPTGFAYGDVFWAKTVRVFKPLKKNIFLPF